MSSPPLNTPPSRLAQLHARVSARMNALSPVARGLVWATVAGLLFQCLNTILRMMTLELPPFQTQFVRYLMGVVLFLPVILRHGIIHYRPNNLRGLIWRGLVHTTGLCCFFLSLPHLSLAYITVIAFTAPIFTMIGAAWFLGERMRPARWIAVLIGFAGVLIVVGPRLSTGDTFYSLVMLASAPVFAASLLITKALTRTDSPSSIVVWQSITVALFSLPLALSVWVWPSATQWAWFAFAGVLGNIGHWALTRSFAVADISATQSVKFLDLVWAVMLGFLVFGDVPAVATLFGGSVILLATVWIARYEGRRSL